MRHEQRADTQQLKCAEAHLLAWRRRMGFCVATVSIAQRTQKMGKEDAGEEIRAGVVSLGHSPRALVAWVKRRAACMLRSRVQRRAWWPTQALRSEYSRASQSIRCDRMHWKSRPRQAIGLIKAWPTRCHPKFPLFFLEKLAERARRIGLTLHRISTAALGKI